MPVPFRTAGSRNTSAIPENDALSWRLNEDESKPSPMVEPKAMLTPKEDPIGK